MSPKRPKSLAGIKVTYDEMQKITKWSNEEKRYEAFGLSYSDFYDFYLREFPGAYPLPRVRMSQKVREFFEASRPEPLKISLEKVKEKVKLDKTLTLYEAKGFVGEPHIRVQQKKDIKRGRPYIDLYTEKDIIVLFNAEIYKYINELVFTPKISNVAEVAYPIETLERKILRALRINQATIVFPEQIRIEGLIGYDAFPDRKSFDARGFPLWTLTEIPIARISFVSEPTVHEIKE